jgi:uncharacterized protein (TIGR02145 family)
MRIRTWIRLFIIAEALLFITSGCKKEIAGSIPEVSTVGLSLITPVSASCTAIVKSEGNTEEVTEKGVCWSLAQSATVTDNKAPGDNLTESRDFTIDLCGLKSNTTYFVRAYAISTSGTIYGNELSFTTPVDHSGEQGTVTDIEGNVYKTIGIGSQIWTAENIRTTRLNDSSEITDGRCFRCWCALLSPGYCFYDNVELNKNIYGNLYNWYTVNTMKLCPSGWHVPSDDEWTILQTYLGGSLVAGEKMKVSENTNADNNNTGNESGFTALPGGYRGEYGVYFNGGESSVFWTSNSVSDDKAIYHVTSTNSPEITWGNNPIRWGASVRCVRNQADAYTR